MQDPTVYFPRIADTMLERALKLSGAVQVKGPKWCGKTATSEQHAASCVYLQDPDRRDSLIALAATKPSLILEGAEPRLIDEWQEAPQLWDAVRYAIDRGHGRGRFILTGSATPSEKPRHSGVGRIARLVMRPMSLYESRESNGNVSLSHLFQTGKMSACVTDFDIEDYAFALCRGGWPEAVVESSHDPDIALAQAKAYVDELLDSDIDRMDEKRRNSGWMRELLRSYARNSASEAALTTIAADMAGEPPSTDTVADYLDALRRAYVIDDLEAWNPRLRSKTAVRTSPTRHFVDPSIATAVMGATPRRLLEDFETFGLLFESMCVRDLRVYAGALDARVYHYRDKTGLESDAVVVGQDGSWAPIEVKLGSQKAIDEGARHLLKLAERVDSKSMGNPAFLMVLTAGQAAYEREDGVLVAPLACLGP